MGRPVRFSEEAMLDGALRVLDEGGARAASVHRIAQRIGASTGSIYHRFRSRDVLIAELWLRTVEEFQRGFAACLACEDSLAAAARAARYTPAWVRTHPREARLLLAHRREDQLDGTWPAEQAARSERLGKDAGDALRGFTTRHFGRCTAEMLARTTLALVDVPYGAVRRHIGEGRTVPEWLDSLVEEAARAILSAT